MAGGRVTACIALAMLWALPLGGVQAQATPAVVAAYPLVPIQLGGTSAEIAFEVDAPAARILLSVSGTSASAGTFSSLSGLAIERDDASAVPFHVRLPLGSPFPRDGVLVLTARAVSTGGATGPEARVVFDAGARSVGFGEAPIQVAPGSSGALTVEVRHLGPVCQTEVSLVGASARAFRMANGTLGDVEGVAFASEQHLVARPRLGAPDRTAFVVPTRAALPFDGVVIVDVAVRDPFGRVAHTSAVELTDRGAIDTLLGVRAAPSPVLLSLGAGQREQLAVTAQYLLGGEVDVSGADKGVEYVSRNEAVVAVTRDGQLVARSNGETDVDVRYLGVDTVVHAIVDSTASVASLRLVPDVAGGDTIRRVGGTTQLRLWGVLTTAREFDLTPGVTGTAWTSSNPAALEVSQDGRVTARRPGTATITALHGELSASIVVDALDAPPEIALRVPRLVEAGASFDLRAEVADDVGVAKVEFLVDGVPIATDTDSPYLLQVRAPPVAGATMRLSAVAVDGAGQRTRSAEAAVRVVAPASSATGIVPVWESPTPGAYLVEGIPQVLRVTSGDWLSGRLAPDDFQSVRFSVDDEVVGTAPFARVELRKMSQGDGTYRTFAVPLWEVSYVPRRGLNGASVSVRAEAVDRLGRHTSAPVVIARTVPDAAPMVRVWRPGATADAIIGAPLAIEGFVADDTASLGVNVTLLAEGVAVATAFSRASGVEGSSAIAGSAPFGFTWKPPAGSAGKVVRLEVEASDLAGHQARIPIAVTVLEDVAPQVAIQSPAADATLSMGSDVTLSATVRDDGVGPVQVAWYAGGRPLGVVASPPYALRWRVPVTADPQTLVLEAVARDSAGHESRSSVAVFSARDASPPTLSIVSPRDTSSIVATEDLLVSVAGLDDVGAVRVEILYDGVVVFQDDAPGTNSGTRGTFISHAVLPRAQLGSPGDHRIGARAYDAAGNVGRAPNVLVHAQADRAPTVAITAPASGVALVSGTTADVVVDASDDVGVRRVDLYLGASLVGTRSIAPFRFAVPIAGAPRASALRAVATDSAGQTAEASLAVTVKADDQRPMVSFRAPTDGALVFAGRTIDVAVVATDNVAVSGVQLFSGAAPLGPPRSRTTEPLCDVFVWGVAIPASAVGTSLRLRAVVTDSAGLSAERTLEVRAVADRPPAITILSPAPGSTFREGEDVQVAFTVDDDDGVVAMTGVSGGVLQGVLGQGTVRVDVGREQVLTVRAPSVSRSAASTIGVAVRDTGGQVTTASVPLDVQRDVEAPTALLTAPLPGAAAIVIPPGGGVGVRVEVEDDVRVERLAVLVDGQELVPADGRPILTAAMERFDAVRVPNSYGPGDAVVSRRYHASYAGTAVLAGIPAGVHRLSVRALDPAGNATETSDVAVEVQARTDRQEPVVQINFRDAPVDGTCVTGHPFAVEVSASDDTRIDALTLTVDGRSVALSDLVTGGTWARATAQVLCPELGGLERVPVNLAATAVDGAGHEGRASAVREAASDRPPSLAILEPVAGAALVEERPEHLRIDVRDDVGTSGEMAVLSTRELVSASRAGLSVAAPAATPSAGIAGATLQLGGAHVFDVGVRQGELAIQAPELYVSSASQLLLSIAPPASGAPVRANVTYRYRIPAYATSYPAVQSFLASSPGGRRTVVLQAPAYSADLSVSTGFVDVEAVDIELEVPEAAPAGVTRLGILFRAPRANGAPQFRAFAAGEAVAVQRAGSGTVARARVVDQTLSLPKGWAPAAARLSAVAIDTAGAVAMETSVHSTAPDTGAPRVSIQSPSMGTGVVDGAPFLVRVGYDDETWVERVDLLVDGTVVESRDVLDIPLSTVFTVRAGLPAAGGPVAITAMAYDASGTPALSAPLYVTVLPDEAPVIEPNRLDSAVEKLTRAELATGYVRILQGVPAELTVLLKDDVGVEAVTIEYQGVRILDQAFAARERSTAVMARFTPTVGADGATSVVLVRTRDGGGHEATARLIIEARRPEGPTLLLAAPVAGAVIPEGTVQLRIVALAGDDTGIGQVDLYLNGRLAIEDADVGVIELSPTEADELGLPIPVDPAIRDAIRTLPAASPYRDPRRLRLYAGTIALAPGLVAAGPGGSEGSLAVHAVATDLEGNATSVDRALRIVADATGPAVELLAPFEGRNVVERTPVRIEVVAHDNAFVDRVEVLAGPTAQALSVVHVAAGFTPGASTTNAADVYAPIVAHLHTVPLLADLGGSAPAPYFVGARARDSSGNWSTLALRYVDVTTDQPPAATIIAPGEGARVVEGAAAPVLVVAEDDVGIAAVRVRVDDVLQPDALTAPPFLFSVPVPPGRAGTSMRIQASATDTFGHVVETPVTTLSVVADAPPTIAIAEPRAGAQLVQGRDLAFVVGAEDDAAVTAVEATVEGGVAGPLRFVATARPFSFRVPLPFGSAGRTLTFRASARDTAGHVSAAPQVVASVVADLDPPNVTFLSPRDAAEVVSGTSLDVEVRADDGVGGSVVNVQFLADAAPVAAMPAPPFRLSYRVPRVTARQPLVLTARASDASGNIGEHAVGLTIVPDAPPSITLVPPSALVAGLPARLAATAGDDLAIAQVSFFVGAEPSRMVEIDRRFILPYEVPYTPSRSDVGQTLYFQARAVDSAGQATWSQVGQAEVAADRPPSVVIQRPLPGAVVFDGGELRIEAKATDPDGGVASVGFFVDGRKVDVALAPAGIAGAKNVYAGVFHVPGGSGNRTFSITAVATDTAGQETISQAVVVGAVHDTAPPAVALIDPPAADVVTEGEQIWLQAAAEDNAGVSRVDFLVAGQLLGSTSQTVPGPAGRPLHRYPWLAPVGAAGQLRQLTAAAVDTSSNEQLSAPVAVELGMRPAAYFDGYYDPYRPASAAAQGPLAIRGDGLFALAVGGSAVGLGRISETGFVRLGEVPVAGRVGGLAFSRNLALATVAPASAASPASLTVLDIGNTALPLLRGSIDLPGPDAFGVAARDRLAFVANGVPGIVLVDLGDPAAPMRLTTVPVVGDARGVAVAGELLLVAAASGGLRVLDLGSPALPELGFVSVPGGAYSVAVDGARAYVGCGGEGAQLAVVDLSTPSAPRLLSVTSHAPGRRDLRATGIGWVAARAGMALASTDLSNQDGARVKGLLTVSAVRRDGTASALVRANLPAGGDVGHGAGMALSLFGERGVAAFAIPRLLVTGMTPADGAEQVALAAPELAVEVELTAPPDPETVVAAGPSADPVRVTVTLRSLDPVLGPVVPAVATVAGRRVQITPAAALEPGTEYFLSVNGGTDPGDTRPRLRGQDGLALSEPFVARFRTRSSSGTPPAVLDVRPVAGPIEGGTAVTVFGERIAPGARLFLSDEEATEVQVSPDGRSLVGRTPAGLEGPARVRVVNPDGLEGALLGGFVYMRLLELGFVAPATGSMAGGTHVELSGAGFERGARVWFGAAEADPASIRVLSPGHLLATTPAGPFGPADVTVQNPDGRRVVAPGAFLFSKLVVSATVGRWDGKGLARASHQLPQATPQAVALSGGRAWVVSQASIAAAAPDAAAVLTGSTLGAVTLVDVSNPAASAVMGSVSLLPPYEPAGIAVRAGLGYVVANARDVPYADFAGEGGPSLLVVDGADPTAPRVVAAVPFEGAAYGIALVDDLALVAAGDHGLALFSLVDPLRPALVGYVEPYLLDGLRQPVVAVAATDGQRYAVVGVGGGCAPGRGSCETRAAVVDLARPGFPVTASLPRVAPLGLAGLRAVSGATLQTFALTPPTAPRFLGKISPLVRSGGSYVGAALGPQLGVLSSSMPAVIEIFGASDATRPQAVDGVDLAPARDTTGVALEGGVIVAALGASGGLDGLAVIGLPFPVVVGASPPDGATGVPVDTQVRIVTSEPVGDADASSVRIVRVDGSTSGSTVPATVTATGTSILVVPGAALQPDATYRIVADGLHAASAAHSPMPVPFTHEFRTASDPTAVPLALTSVSPRTGPSAGGTLVTLTGDGFEPSVEVRFAGQAAEILSRSRGELRVRTPAGAAGAATITIANPSGGVLSRTGTFLYADPLALLAVSPARGPSSGGTRVTLQGSGFSLVGRVDVLFGGVPALDVRVLGLGQISAVTPDGGVGTVDVTVRNPDGTSATRARAFTFDQPSSSSVRLASRVHDQVVVGDHAFVAAGRSGLQVVDLTGRYTAGPSAGLYIPPTLRSGLVDEDRDGRDDRVVGSSPALLTDPVLQARHLGEVVEVVSVAWATGTDRLFLGLRVAQPWVLSPAHVTGGVVQELDVSDPRRPRVVGEAPVGGDAAYGVDGQGDRLLSAAGAVGLRVFDVSHAPFPVGAVQVLPGAQAIAVEGGVAAVATGVRDLATDAVSGGALELHAVAGMPLRLGSVSVGAQRVRLRDGLAAVAAGDRGLVLVDVRHPETPAELASVDVGGFAWDVRLSGDLAYVAAGPAGVAVVDLSDVLHPRVLSHVTGASGGEARAVALAGGRLVTSRDRGYAGWAIDFGDAADLTVTGASVAAGQIVPVDLQAVSISLSTAVDPATAPSAIALLADGTSVPGVVEGGAPGALQSTIVFRPRAALPAGAALELIVGTQLATPEGKALRVPFRLEFRAASGPGGVPQLSQVVPRVGPATGGAICELLGAGFEPGAVVRVGGAPATVLAESATRLTIATPPGVPGLADVEVENLSGLADRRAGAYLYSAPVHAASATPRFLDPRGGSVVTVEGAGFLPEWASALGGTQVRVRGVPATSIRVESSARLVFVAPPGSFGPADVTVSAADGLSASTAAPSAGYGLELAGEERVTSVRPAALAVGPAQPLLVYAAAGPLATTFEKPPGVTWDGNHFVESHLTPYGMATLNSSFRVATYDVTQAGRPRAAGAQVVALDGARLGFAGGNAEVEVGTDALDVAIARGQVLVANGRSGLAVIDESDPLRLPVLSAGPIADDALATRVSPTATGALVTWAALQMAERAQCPERSPDRFTPKATVAVGVGGRLELYDTRDAAHPLRVAAPGVGDEQAEPFGATIAGGRLFVVTGLHAGTYFCPDPYYPPPPSTSLSLGAARPDAGAPRGALLVYDSAGPDAKIAGRVEFPSSVTDVVVAGDVAIVAVWEEGLAFVDVSDPAHPVVAARIPFDASLSNAFDPARRSGATLGHPFRLRLTGDLLVASALRGGVVVVDVSNPRSPSVVSAGNSELAQDALAVGDRLLVAGGDRVSELSLPFSFATAISPARGDVVPPARPVVSVRFNRPIAAASVTAATVRLLDAAGTQVPVELDTTEDFTRQEFTVRIQATADLQPDALYRVELDTGVTDARGGGLLIPVRSTFRTGLAGGRAPRLSSVEPTAVGWGAGGSISPATVVLRGQELAGASQVTIGGRDASIVARAPGGDGLTVTVPAPARSGPADVRVVDAGGSSATLALGLLYLDDLSAARVTLAPDHGPVDGGTAVTLKVAGSAPIGPGTRVFLDDVEVTDVRLVDLSTLIFRTPRSGQAGLVAVRLVRPDGASAAVGSYSFDLPTGSTVDLPGFPPRVASEIALRGDTLFVGVPSRGAEGLEIFDVSLPERPLRLGGARTDGAVRGLDVAGALALVAADDFGLIALDVSDPASPFEVARAMTPGKATAVRVEGAVAHLAVAGPGAESGAILRHDLDRPGMPLLGSTPLDADPLALELGSDRYFALTTHLQSGIGDGLWLSVYTRTGVLRGRVLVDGAIAPYDDLVRSRLMVRAGRAYVSCGSRLLVFDLADETAPRRIEATTLGAPASGLAWLGGSLYAATSGSSTLVLVPPTRLLPVEVSPAPGSVATVDAVVRVSFTLPVAPASVTPTSFSVSVEDGAGLAPVSGTRDVVFAVRGSSIVFRPAVPLVPGQVVHVDVAGVTAFDTSPLAVPVHSTFLVASDGALQPVIASITPATGPVDQETEVVIAGSGFRAGDEVLVGGQAAVVYPLSASQLRVIVPARVDGVAGPVGVVVRDPAAIEVGGAAVRLEARRAGGFLYRDALRLTSVAPDRSPQYGGTQVTLRGYGFLPGMRVDFGDARSWDVQVEATGRAVAVAPPHSAGLVDVVASVEGRAFTRAKAFLYGAGAVAHLTTPPIGDVLVDGLVAYAALGAETDIVGVETIGGVQVLRTYASGRATAGGGLLVADLAEPTNVRRLVTVDLPGRGGARRIAKRGARLFVAAGDGGLAILDVTLPARTQVVATLQPKDAQGAALVVQDVAVAGDLVFVGDSEGLRVYRTGEAELPIEVARRPFAGGVTALAVHGRLLLVSTASPGDAQLRVLDARTGDLVQLGAISLAAPARHLTAEGTRAFASLGRARQVAIVELTDPTNPAPAGAMILDDPLGVGWVSAEQTLVAGGIAWVAAGGGDLQRFAVPVGQAPAFVERASATGDVRSVAAMGRYLLAGTLVLDVAGTPVEMPVAQADEASGSLAGALSSVLLDHLELRGSVPEEAGLAAVSEPIQVLLSALPDPATGSSVGLSNAQGAPVEVTRRVAADAAGGVLALHPTAALALGAEYVLDVGAGLSDLAGGKLGTPARVRFRTAGTASSVRPRIDAASPGFGLREGGDVVEVLGAGFLPGCVVDVGGQRATLVDLASDGTWVRIVVPPGAAGAAAVEVVNPGGLSALHLGAYRYLLPPRITAVDPPDARYGSRQVVKLTGEGLFGGSQVTFAGVPAASAVLGDDGALRVEVPDGVIGAATVRLSTPRPGGATWHELADGFTFTLPRLGATTGWTEAYAGVGSVVLSAGLGVLRAIDLSTPTSPHELSTVPGVASDVGGLVVVGRTAWLTGRSEVVRYDLGTCGAAPLATCVPAELDRTTLGPLNTQLNAVAADERAAYVAVGGGTELTLLGAVAGGTEVVSEVFATGNIAALTVVGDGEALAVLVSSSPGSRLELRSLRDGRLELLSSIPLPGAAYGLASQGTWLAAATGETVTLVDGTDAAAAYALATFTVPDADNAGQRDLSRGVAFGGPFVLTGTMQKVYWLDATRGLALRTWACPTGGVAHGLGVVDGLALVGQGQGIELLDLPYPVPSVTSPLPGGRVAAGGDPSITFPGRIPLATATASRIVLAGPGGRSPARARPPAARSGSSRRRRWSATRRTPRP